MAAVILYDGRCRLCLAASKRLVRLARPGRVEARDFQQPGVLAAFPGLAYEACLREMHLVLEDGRVLRGVQAVAEVLALRGGVFRLARLCGRPGLRRLLAPAYAFVARHRYRLGRAPACDDAGCARPRGRRP